MHNNLTELVDLNGELHTALARMVRMGERTEGGRSAEKANPFDIQAAEAIRIIRMSLADWVRDVAKTTGMPLPVNSATANMVNFLVAALPEMAAHQQEVQLLAREAKHWCWKARQAVDLQPRRFALGPCPETIPETGEQCHGTVRVMIPVEEELPGRVTCRTCESEWTGEQWPRLYARISAIKPEPDPVIEIRDCAVALGVGLSTIRRWLRLGLLVPPRKGYVRLSDAWRVREELRARRLSRLAQYAV